MRCSLVVLGAVVAAVVLVACSGDADDTPPTEPSITESPPPGDELVGLSLDLPAEARSGATVTFKLIVTNPSAELVELTTGLPYVSFTLTAQDGTLVWPPLEGGPAPLIHHTFAPGQSQEFTTIPAEQALVAESGDPLPPGDYVVQGFFHEADGTLESEPAVLTVVP
jgi:hypothetical protein